MDGTSWLGNRSQHLENAQAVGGDLDLADLAGQDHAEWRLDQLATEFQQSHQGQQWFTDKETQQQLHILRTAEWVDYSRVVALKLQGLRFAFIHFKQNPIACRQQAFERFVNDGGESLQIQATFDALHAHLASRFSEQWGWEFWASEYQDYYSDAVKQFRIEYEEEVEFYAWLQFCADQQLAECNAFCKAQNMSIGMYRDLAVGVTGNGAETWCAKELYCLQASIGAPPDILAPQGQNWGLIPMNPHILKQQAYQPFIELVRANMSHCGALRIDHIMSLLRLWWIPKGDKAANGAYIRYPVDDLIAILALESHRHHLHRIDGKRMEFWIYTQDQYYALQY